MKLRKHPFRGLARIAMTLLALGALQHTANAATAEWTVMVFMNGDNDLEKYAFKDFLEMSTIGSTDDMNVVVQMDRIPYGYTAPNADEEWAQTLRFKIEKDMRPKRSLALADLGESNMGDGKVLSDFVAWTKQNYPAKKYLLVIWDHGQGWRFASRYPLIAAGNLEKYMRSRVALVQQANAFRAALPDAVQRMQSLQSAGSGRFALQGIAEPVLGAVKSVSVDDTDRDMLFNREIQDNLKADGDAASTVIGFDACLMGMIETAYAMRDRAAYMVASEELEPGDGWDYRLVLDAIARKPTMNTKEVAQAIVDAYKAQYENVSSDVTLSAIQLSEIAPFSQRFSTFSRDLISTISISTSRMKQARGNVLSYAPIEGLHGIDLAQLLGEIESQFAGQSIAASARDVAAAMRRAVVANYAGTGRQGRYGSHGLAVYFPASRADFEDDPDHDGYLQSNTNFPVEFVEKESWDEFLSEYYRHVP